MFVACGTPIVGLDAVYMHLAHRPRFHARETVETNRRIGSVGVTGNASGWDARAGR